MASPQISAHTMERLVFVRLMHQQAIDQTDLPYPMSCLGVLTLHDAVEMFLVLTGEQLGASLPPFMNFMKYWELLHPDKHPGGVDLSSKAAMDRLNRVRNDFKHHGIMPAPVAIERARADVASFFEDNTTAVFGIPYDGITMADLIPQEKTRETVKRATETNEAGDRTEAMALLSDAFDLLFKDHPGASTAGISAFSFGEDIHHPLRLDDVHQVLRSSDRFAKSRQLAEQLTKVTRTAMLTQSAMRIVALGIEYHEYYRFTQLIPHIFYSINGQREPRPIEGYEPTVEDFEFCQRFIITVALRLAEVEAYVAPPPWKMRGRH